MSNRRQRVSIESCFLENKRITIVITKKAALKTFDPNRGKITTAELIPNDYRQKLIRVETCNGPLCVGKQASEYSTC